MKLDDQAWSDLVRNDVFARLGVRAVTISQRRFAAHLLSARRSLGG